MRKHFILATIGVLLPLLSFCQFWEFGIMLGGSNYSGDLATPPIVVSESHGAIGAIVRANVSEHFTFKGNVYYGRISGRDTNSSVERLRMRNLSFRSDVLDIGINAEYNILGFKADSRDMRTSPYLFAGISVFKFDPKAYFKGDVHDNTGAVVETIDGEWIRLQPLGTEGQGTTQYNEREKYALTQISIPFGVGLKHNFAHNWGIGFELGWRKTFTDYLDDVSNTYANPQILGSQRGPLSRELAYRTDEITGEPQVFVPEDTNYRGNPSTQDWYMFAGLTFTYTILPNTCFKF